MERGHNVLAWGWDILISVCATAAALYVPAHLVLGFESTTGLILPELIVTAVFVLDIGIRYRRSGPFGEDVGRGGTPRKGQQVAGAVIDIAAALPVYFILGNTPLMLLRLLKLGRVAQLMRRWRSHQIKRVNALRLAFFLYGMALSSHWIACGWIEIRGVEAGADRWTRYLEGLYWCVTTLSTVGYGDVAPENNLQRMYAMGVMMLGVGVYGFIIGTVSTILANLDPARVNYLQKMEQVGAFMSYRDLPNQLQQRIKDYYRYLWQQKLDHNEGAVLSGLPPSLGTEVTLFLKRDLLEHVPLFKDASEAFIREIALEMKSVVFMPGDYVIRAGDRGRDMYFVTRGTLEALSPDGTTVYSTMSKGDFFGEMALVFDQPRSASVRAIDYCDLYRLDRDLFDHVLTHFPDIAEKVKARAAERQRGQ